MVINIGRGLFKYNFIDQHAVLGLPVDSDTKEVRQRYIAIAKALHPDRCKAETPEEKKQATELLSKLINPAYEKLSQDRNRNEYSAILKRLGQQVVVEATQIQLHTEEAKQVMQAGANLDLVYKNAIKKLAGDQYASVAQEKIVEMIGNISELNMVYLLRKEGRGGGARPAPPPPATKTSTPAPKPSAPEPTSHINSQIEAYIRRAEDYMAKGNTEMAIKELRDALPLNQSSGTCHGLLGLAYIKQKQVGMAKVHIKRALELNPQEPSALKAQSLMNVGSTPDSKSPSGKPNPGNKGKKDEPKSRWPFGKK
jgi:curved DNA-binding protein CbpA